MESTFRQTTKKTAVKKEGGQVKVDSIFNDYKERYPNKPCSPPSRP